jgi:hypothetical protein
MDAMADKFHHQRRNAKTRGIPFLMTFDQWKAIWLESGKWEQRGFRRGQYVMSRLGDRGAYVTGNVKVCLVGENHGEFVSRRHKGHPKSEQMREALRAARTGTKRVFRDGRSTWERSTCRNIPA